MAKIQKKDGSLVIKKSFWSVISIWWAILVFMVAIPGALFAFVLLDYNTYMAGVVEYEPLVQYAQTLNVKPTVELYIEALKDGQIAQAYQGGMFGLTASLVSGGKSLETLQTIKAVIAGAAIAIFAIAFISFIAKLISTKKTSWTFYDGAVIYKKGRVFYTEEATRDMEFFPGMSVSVRRTIKGKLCGYGDVVISNGAGEAGEIVMLGVKNPKKVQKALRNMLAMACTRTANMMSPYKMYPQMYRHVLGGYPAYYYSAMQGQNAKK